MAGSLLLRRLFRHLQPALPAPGGKEAVRAAIGAMLGVAVAAVLAHLLGHPELGLMMIAPFGATAVLVFGVPNSPLAQPWSAIAGNTLSALVGVATVVLVSDPVLRPPLAVGGAVLAMLLGRALHPPGGAVALTAALSPELLVETGWMFAFAPVFVGTAFLTLLAVPYAHLTGRRYPFRQAPASTSPRDVPPADRIGVSRAELAAILGEYRQATNIGVEDLARLIRAAETLAMQHELGEPLAEHLMSRDLVTVGPATPLSEVAAIFQIHLIRGGPAASDRGLQRGPGLWRRLAVLTGNRAPGRADRAGDVMTTDVPQALPTTTLATLLPLLSRGDCDALPVVVDARLVGIVTQSDLIAALARRHG